MNESGRASIQCGSMRLLQEIAKALGALPKEIYFTSGGSEADNQAIESAVLYGLRKGKCRIVSTAIWPSPAVRTFSNSISSFSCMSLITCPRW